MISLAAGSLVIGRLGDRYPRYLLMQIGTGLGTLAMFAGVFMRTEVFALFLLVVAGFGMAAIVALGYPLFASVAGSESPAAYTGVFVMSVGIGRILAPILVGGAIDTGRNWFAAEQGYPMMWLVAGVLMLAGSAALWYASLDKHRRTGGLDPRA